MFLSRSNLDNAGHGHLFAYLHFLPAAERLLLTFIFLLIRPFIMAGITLLFTEPPDAQKPNVRWRLYVFKGGEVLNGRLKRAFHHILSLSKGNVVLHCAFCLLQ